MPFISQREASANWYADNGQKALDEAWMAFNGGLYATAFNLAKDARAFFNTANFMFHAWEKQEEECRTLIRLCRI